MGQVDEMVFTPTQEIFDFTNTFHESRDIREKMVISTPRPMTIFPHEMEARNIPTLPNTVNSVPMTEDADPVSLSCCSSSRLVLKGRITAPDKDIKRKEIQNNIGVKVPRVMTKIPLNVEMAKIIEANNFLSILLRNFT